MSALFSANIANYLKTGVVADRAYPGSMFCWFRWPTDDNLLEIMLFYGDDDTGRQNWNLGLSGGGGASRDKFQAGERNESGNETATSSAQTVANTWYAGGGIFRGSADRSCYLNGTRANSAVTEGLGTQSNVIIGIGGLLDSSATNPWNGNIAHAAVWDADIGDAGMTALAAGVNPLHISPGNLIFYHPLTHNDAGDFFESTSITGTVTFPGDMPPVQPYRPMYSAPITPAAAVGGGGRIMSSLAASGGLAGMGGIAGQGGGLAA